MHTRHLDVDGARLGYDEHGDGPVVIVAHGLARSRAVERRVGLSRWDELEAAGFRVVSYDARGHGGSTGRAVPEDYRWAALAEDLLALADAVSPDAPVHAIGTSMGTATIVHALTRRPERLRSVTLTAPPTAWETRRAQGRLYSANAAAAESMTAEEFAAEWTAGAPPQIFAGLDVSPRPDVAIELMPSLLRGCALTDMPADDAISAIPVPTLILPWATDPGHPLSTAERLAALIPHAECEAAEDVETVRGWPSRAARFFVAHP